MVDTSLQPTSNEIAAGVTAYGRDANNLPHLIAAVSPCVARVYVFVNGAIEPQLRAAIAAVPKVEMIESDTNLGVGVALNMMALAAIRAGFERLCFFDQDSRVRPALVTRLSGAMDALRRRGERPAVVAPRLVGIDEHGGSKTQVYAVARRLKATDDLLPVQFAATSGSLVDLACLRGTGFFRADYFIDAIDVEWCYRAQAAGFSCWIANQVVMEHPVGSGVIRLPLVPFSMPDQAPVRMYCHFRNSTYGLRLRHIALAWKLKQICYLPLQALVYFFHHRCDARIGRRVLAGFVDGLRGRLGSPVELG